MNPSQPSIWWAIISSEEPNRRLDGLDLLQAAQDPLFILLDLRNYNSAFLPQHLFLYISLPSKRGFQFPSYFIVLFSTPKYHHHHHHQKKRKRKRKRKISVMAASRYWIVSLPVQTSHSSLWSRLQESISKQSFDTPLYRVRKIKEKNPNPDPPFSYVCFNQICYF